MANSRTAKWIRGDKLVCARQGRFWYSWFCSSMQPRFSMSKQVTLVIRRGVFFAVQEKPSQTCNVGKLWTLSRSSSVLVEISICSRDFEFHANREGAWCEVSASRRRRIMHRMSSWFEIRISTWVKRFSSIWRVRPRESRASSFRFCWKREKWLYRLIHHEQFNEFRLRNARTDRSRRDLHGTLFGSKILIVIYFLK